MPVLTNARHERFAQALVRGMNASAAYVEAGYKPNGPNAARLTKNDEIKNRVAELQGSTAEVITDICDFARRRTRVAIDTLVSVMEDGNAPASARVSAANAILDRGYGKAPLVIDQEPNAFERMSFEERRWLLGILDAEAERRGLGEPEPPGNEVGPTLTRH